MSCYATRPRNVNGSGRCLSCTVPAERPAYDWILDFGSITFGAVRHIGKVVRTGWCRASGERRACSLGLPVRRRASNSSKITLHDPWRRARGRLASTHTAAGTCVRTIPITIPSACPLEHVTERTSVGLTVRVRALPACLRKQCPCPPWVFVFVFVFVFFGSSTSGRTALPKSPTTATLQATSKKKLGEPEAR